jgi:hypothetical protein
MTAWRARACLLFLLAGLFLPLYPLSIGANLLLKRQVGVDGADPLCAPVRQGRGHDPDAIDRGGLMQLGLALGRTRRLVS